MVEDQSIGKAARAHRHSWRSPEAFSSSVLSGAGNENGGCLKSMGLKLPSGISRYGPAPGLLDTSNSGAPLERTLRSAPRIMRVGRWMKQSRESMRSARGRGSRDRSAQTKEIRSLLRTP